MKRKRLTRVLLTVGTTLLLGAAIWALWMQYSVSKNAKRAQEVVQTLYTLMPRVTDGAPDDRVNVTMSTIEVDQLRFAGIIEIPAYERTLPIYGKWARSKVKRFPCRYLGSMYDGSLIIGGSDNDGQFDFIKQISNGDRVYVTDTTGVRYSYTVVNIRRTKDVSTQNICMVDADLIFFAKNSYSMDYTVVYCSLS